MSQLLKSWLPSRPRGSNSHLELPLFNTPPTSPERQPAFPPPPLTGSVLAPASSVRSTSAGTAVEQPASPNAVYLRRAERQLEAELHRLLDEQSDALQADADAARQPQRQPRQSHHQGGLQTAADTKEQHDLPATRRAIHHAVRELAAVKAAQEADARHAHKETARTVARLDGWAAKRAALRHEVARLSRGVAAAAGNPPPPPIDKRWPRDGLVNHARAFHGA